MEKKIGGTKYGDVYKKNNDRSEGVGCAHDYLEPILAVFHLLESRFFGQPTIDCHRALGWPLGLLQYLLFIGYRLAGLVVKESASRAEDPGFESCLRLDFSGVEYYQ